MFFWFCFGCQKSENLRTPTEYPGYAPDTCITVYLFYIIFPCTLIYLDYVNEWGGGRYIVVLLKQRKYSCRPSVTPKCITDVKTFICQNVRFLELTYIDL